MQPFELRHLLEKYIDHSISAEEFSRLWKSLDENRFDSEWFEVIEQVLNNKKLHGLSDREQMTERLAQIRKLIRSEEPVTAQQISTAKGNPPVHLITHRLVRYAAAAAILVAFGVYLLTRTTHNRMPPIAATEQLPASVKPGMQKARLTLADGTVITLDNMANGKIAQQGATQVLKLANGQIQYQAATTADQDTNPGYNTNSGDNTAYNNIMSTPRGGQYRLTLPDGTDVWLNAESSITYPTAFAGNSRKVKITGEVYFEVAKDKNKPFEVTAGDQEIEVLGTHFNINAYADEDHIKTSLLEGAVRVNKVLLQPGQAFMHGKIEPTDGDQDVAWKNGVFNFNNQTLTQVMRQLARWYDLDVVYPQGVPKKEYGGEMGRNLTLDQVLKGLENSGIRFQLNGRRLTVKP